MPTNPSDLASLRRHSLFWMTLLTLALNELLHHKLFYAPKFYTRLHLDVIYYAIERCYFHHQPYG